MPSSRPSGIRLGAFFVWGVNAMYSQIMAWMIVIGLVAHFTPVMWVARFLMFSQRTQASHAIAKADWQAQRHDGQSFRSWQRCQQRQARWARRATRPAKLPQYRNGEPVRRFRRHNVKY